MFRGNWTNCIRIIPNSAVKFLTYEQLSRRGTQPVLLPHSPHLSYCMQPCQQGEVIELP